jgi:acetoin utilization protein AcuB
MKKRPIAAYMTKSPHTIGVEQTLTQAHELMRAFRVRHLPVLAAGKLVGLVSQRDLHLIEALSDVNPSAVRVEEAMSQLPFTVAGDTALDVVVAEMADRRVGSAVITDEGRVVGVFTTTDALRVLAGFLRGAPAAGRPGRAA